MFGFTELVKGKATHSTKAVCITPGTVVSFSSDVIKTKLSAYGEDNKLLLESLADQLLNKI